MHLSTYMIEHRVEFEVYVKISFLLLLKYLKISCTMKYYL